MKFISNYELNILLKCRINFNFFSSDLNTKIFTVECFIFNIVKKNDYFEQHSFIFSVSKNIAYPPLVATLRQYYTCHWYIIVRKLQIFIMDCGRRHFKIVCLVFTGCYIQRVSVYFIRQNLRRYFRNFISPSAAIDW